MRAAVCADMRRAGLGAVYVRVCRGAQAAATQPEGAAEHQTVEQCVELLAERKRFLDGAGEHCVFKLRAKLVDLRAKIEQFAGRRDGIHSDSSFMVAMEWVVDKLGSDVMIIHVAYIAQERRKRSFVDRWRKAKKVACYSIQMRR